MKNRFCRLAVLAVCVVWLCIGAVACRERPDRGDPSPDLPTVSPTGTDVREDPADTEDPGIPADPVPTETDLPEKTPSESCDHRYILYDHANPGCTMDGYDIYRCTECGDSYSVIFPALGHDYVLAERSAPCASEGAWAVYYCSREDCPAVYRDTTPSAAHVCATWETVTPAGCESDGLERSVCDACGETVYRTLYATGHTVVYRLPRDGGEPAEDCLSCGADEDIRETYLPVPRGDSVWGYRCLGSFVNGRAMRRLYADVLEQLLSFGSNDKKGDVCAAFTPSAYHLTMEEGLMVLAYLRADSPMIFWLDTKNDVSSQTVRLFVRREFRDAADRLTVDAELQAIISDICSAVPVNGLQQYADYERAVAAYRAIKTHVSLRGDGTADSVAEFAHGGSCDSGGYANMVAAVMNRLGFPCIFVQGTYEKNGAVTEHAWNMINLQKGWYWLDAASDDADDAGWMRNFAPRSESFLSTHAPGISSRQYYLPQPADGNISPVTLLADGEEIGRFPSVKAAFDAMKKNAADYTVIPDADLAVADASVDDPFAWKVILPGGFWPAAKSITFSGQAWERDRQYPQMPVYELYGDAELRCPVTVRDATIAGGKKISLGMHCLTLCGTAAVWDLRTDGHPDSSLVFSYPGGFQLEGEIDVGKLVVATTSHDVPPVILADITCFEMQLGKNAMLELRGGYRIAVGKLRPEGRATLNLTDRIVAAGILEIGTVVQPPEETDVGLTVNLRVTHPACYPRLVLRDYVTVPVLFRIDGTGSIPPVILPGHFFDVLYVLKNGAASWRVEVGDLPEGTYRVEYDAEGNCRFSPDIFNDTDGER